MNPATWCALETSLVEWKHLHARLTTLRALPLETSLVEWKREAPEGGRLPLSFLGNFLSGMETRVFCRRLSFAFHRLGNFLSGMET